MVTLTGKDGTVSQTTSASSSCHCATLKEEILGALEQKFGELRQEIQEAKRLDGRTTDHLMKEVSDRNAEVLTLVNESTVTVKNEILETLRENSNSTKNEVLEELRVQSEHIQNNAKENMTEQFGRLTSEVATLSAEMKQTKDFSDGITSVLKQLLDKSQMAITEQKKEHEKLDIRLAQFIEKSDKTLALAEEKFEDVNKIIKQQLQEQEQSQEAAASPTQSIFFLI